MSREQFEQTIRENTPQLRALVLHNLPLLVGLLIGLIVASLYGSF
jgi:hypothetical protein